MRQDRPGGRVVREVMDGRKMVREDREKWRIVRGCIQHTRIPGTVTCHIPVLTSRVRSKVDWIVAEVQPTFVCAVDPIQSDALWQTDAR